jgi:AcrR family transcriptional regulator
VDAERPLGSEAVTAEPEATRPDEARPERLRKGLTLAERRQERRAAILAAALELFGTKGYASTTVEELCRTAYVSTRNFYEEFDNRSALLAALGEAMIGPLLESLTQLDGGVAGPDLNASLLRDRVASLVHVVVDDPRIARVAFIETQGVSPIDYSVRHELLRVFPAWLQSYLQDHLTALDISPRRQAALAVGVFGAAAELMSDWVLAPESERSTVDELVDDIVEVATLVLRLPRPAGAPTGR